jgi:hypothetical protein
LGINAQVGEKKRKEISREERGAPLPPGREE